MTACLTGVRVGAFRHEQKGDAEPKPGLQEDRAEAQDPLQGKCPPSHPQDSQLTGGPLVQCEINKTDLALQSMSQTNLVLLGGPRMPFTSRELQDVRSYIE